VFCSTEEKPLIGTSADLFEYFGAPRLPFVLDGTFSDNEEKELCQITVKALLTPGHTKGSVCYLFTEKDGGRYLFTGDTLFQGSIGRTDFPTGNMGEMQQSLRRLSALEDSLPIYPGHNDESTIGIEKRENPFMER
jgi:glyoxylase-like metal-dependent hydrolase (beta-lactamase superfamily II)